MPVAVLVLLAGQATQSLADQTIRWHSDLRSALQKTDNSERPLLLFVTMNNCRYCTLMKQQTYMNKKVVADVNGSFVPAKINAHRFTKLISKLGIRIYPSTIVIGPDRQVIEKIPGYVDADELRTRLAMATAKLKSGTH